MENEIEKEIDHFIIRLDELEAKLETEKIDKRQKAVLETHLFCIKRILIVMEELLKWKITKKE